MYFMLVSSSEAARLHPDRGRNTAEPAGGSGGGQPALALRRGRLRINLDSCGTVDHGCGSSGSNGWIDYITGYGRLNVLGALIMIS